MVVNLADDGGNRFVQLAITLQLDDPKIAEDMKIYMPAIRNGILMLISQRTAERILSRRGQGRPDAGHHRRDLLRDGLRLRGPAWRRRGCEAETETPAPKSKKPKRKRAVYNPIRGVLFSSFIVQ